MFRVNPQHSGIYKATGVPEYTRLKWKFHTGGQVVSTPAVVGDAVYVGSNNHSLYAISLKVDQTIMLSEDVVSDSDDCMA